MLSALVDAEGNATAAPAQSGAGAFCPQTCRETAHFCRNSDKKDNVDPNPITNMCDNCDAGFHGPTCESCTNDLGCHTGSHEKHCVHSTTFHDENPAYFDCDLVDDNYMPLLSNGREGVDGKVQIKWTKPTGWARSDNDGRMDFTMFRVEPNGLEEDTPYLLPFFKCVSKQCKMTRKYRKVGEGPVHNRIEILQDGNVDGTMSPETQSTDKVINGLANSAKLAVRGWVLVGLMVLSSSILFGAGFIKNGKLRRKTVSISGIALSIELLLLIVSNLFAMHSREEEKKGNSGGNETYTEVTYECEGETECGCAPQDPNFKEAWQPSCIGQPFENVLKQIKNVVKIICDAGDVQNEFSKYFEPARACVFVPDDIATLPIIIRCSMSQCVTNETATDIETFVSGSSSLVLELTFGALCLAVLAIVVHFVYTIRVTDTLMREWREKYKNSTEQGNIQQLQVIDHNEDEYGDSPPRTRAGSEAASPAPATLKLGTRLLSYHIGEGADALRILNKITLEVPHGESLAIMGPSGAGKTTLLDLLAARDKSGIVTGSLLLNDAPITPGRVLNVYKDIVGYVSQQDSLLPTLTVYESVLYSARLRLPAAMPDEVKRQRVTKVIEDLGLSHCKDSHIGGAKVRGISGGEKRRVSIAMELVAHPRILFLDEPTSGLDSYSALVVMQTISKMKNLRSEDESCPEFARFFNYKTVLIFSIHQPSREIFSLFDNLMLLSKGSLLYCGKASQALETFARLGYRAPDTTTNASDFLLKIASTLTTNERSVLASTALTALPCGNARENSVVSDHSEHIFAGFCSDEDSDTEHDALITMSDTLVTPNTERISDGRPHGPRRPAPHALPAALQEAEANRRYYVNFYQELAIVGRRGFHCLVGNYYLVMCHVVVTLALGGLLLVFYSRQPLTLPGILNRAGCLSFTMILLGFSSMSALELFLNEREVYVAERNNRYYGSLSYFLTKIVFDIIPLRIIPPLFLGSITYNQMGLRTVCFGERLGLSS